MLKRIAGLVALLCAGCVAAPYTGRRQLMLISEGQETASGQQAYEQILRQSVLSDDPQALRLVQKVGQRIARAADKPDYRWEFRIINDPETVNAFCVPGGKVAVYSGIFPVAQDEAGLAVILGHEVAHALLRHAGERMSQSEILGTGLALAGATGLNPQVLQALGLGATVGLVLPFSRSQESEADRVGLLLMAKAGYDPRAALQVWDRMEQKQSGKSAPPDFLSTHPGYQARTQQLRALLPQALRFYHPTAARLERLPSPESLDSPTAKSERELLKNIQAIDRYVQEQHGERSVVEAMARELRQNAQAIFQERQQLRVGYGSYAALKGLGYLSRTSIGAIVADYQRGRSWSAIAQSRGRRVSELTDWVADLIRTTGSLARQQKSQQFHPGRRGR